MARLDEADIKDSYTWQDPVHEAVQSPCTAVHICPLEVILGENTSIHIESDGACGI